MCIDEVLHALHLQLLHEVDPLSLHLQELLLLGTLDALVHLCKCLDRPRQLADTTIATTAAFAAAAALVVTTGVR